MGSRCGGLFLLTLPLAWRRLRRAKTPEEPTTLTAVGEIDSHTSTRLDQALAALGSDQAIVIDLSQVTFVDSSGLRVIVAVHNRVDQAGGALTLRDPSEAVLRLLEITGLVDELRIS